MAHRAPQKLKQNGILGKLFGIIIHFLNFRKQKVFLNGQYSSLTSIECGVPQGSILAPLLFLIHIDDLPDDLSINVKLFVYDLSLFSLVHNMNMSIINLNQKLGNSVENEVEPRS